MPEVDKAALQKILQELLQVVAEIRAFIPSPSNKTDFDARKVPADNQWLQLPPPKKWKSNEVRLQHSPGSEKECKLCGEWMSDIVFFPCQHCVICQHCWTRSYAILGRDGRPSAFARADSLRCPVDGCTAKIKFANSLWQYKGQVGREDEVKYRQKNEYLGDSNALV